MRNEYVLTKQNVDDWIERCYDGNSENVRFFTVPSNCTVIGSGALAWLPNLELVIFPKRGVTRIESNAFRGCTELKIVRLPTTLETIESWAFSECKSLMNVRLPEGLKTIRTCAFERCYNFTEVRLPTTIRCVESNAFKECRRVKNVVIPYGASGLQYRAFADLRSLWRVPKIPSTQRGISCADIFEGSTFLVRAPHKRFVQYWRRAHWYSWRDTKYMLLHFKRRRVLNHVLKQHKPKHARG